MPASMMSSTIAGGESGYATLMTTHGVFAANIRHCESSVSKVTGDVAASGEVKHEWKGVL
jgi:hypothetical protein